MKKLLFVLCILILAACNSGGPTPTLPPTAPAASTPTTPAATAAIPTSAPSPTPVQGRVVLVAPTETGAALVEGVRALVAQAQLAFETRPALSQAELKPEFKIIIFLQAPADLAALTTAAPNTQFAAPGGSELAPAANLSVMRQSEEQRAFLAGYIATLVAPDWRSAGLLPDAPASLMDAFVNGGRYWCGRCVPVYAPVVLFPLAAVQKADAAPSAWSAALAPLQKSVLQSVYLSPQAQSPELLAALAAQKLILVGTRPPSAEAKSVWAATLSFDPMPALQRMWTSLLAGKGGQSANAGLVWSDVNESTFTTGKQRLAQQVLAGLQDGSISPLSVP